MKLWDKKSKLKKEIEDFTVGKDYLLDQKLIKYDCEASFAHAAMLEKINILTKEELGKIESVFEEIKSLAKQGKFTIKKEQEDCHTAIESYLTEKLGDIGKKIHTGRSRNDQVQVVLRLFYKDNLKQIIQLCKDFSDAGKKLTDKHGAIKMPGYTHMQKAMPSSIGLWIGSFSASMEDNIKYLEYVLTLIDQNPLGGAAGFGTPGLEVDKELTAKLLKFAKVQENSLYVQLSRGKFEGIIVSALGAVLLDLNKLATDLMLYTMSEFDFFSLPDNFLTGSSIMPQKKNYDVFELVRGKYHIVLGYEMQLKSICGNLISGYNRDMQLTKEPVMNALEVANDCISIMTLVINNLKVHKEKCEKAVTNELYTTEKAYKMVKQGKTFRDAYHSLK